MNNIITNPISNIPVNPKSHTLGWSKVWSKQLSSPIDHKCTPLIRNADTVYIDHGANFGGTLNLFGGATEELFNRINSVMACNEVVSLDFDMPDYGAQLKKRLNAKTTYEGITEAWCDAVSSRISAIKSLKQHDSNAELTGITLGDSHSISFSDTKDHVLRNDGKTLHSSLAGGLKNMFRGMTPFGNITLSLGSIDIRHHLLRRDFNLKEIIAEYVSQGKELESMYGCSVSFAAPVPVEFEGRRVPKTGYYKKTPFYGSMEERKTLTASFIQELHSNKITVVQPPEHWYTMDPEKYATTYMEFGGSFHIAPPFYRRNNWGMTELGA
jgi:hypothetical protein